MGAILLRITEELEYGKKVYPECELTRFYPVKLKLITDA